MSDQSIVEVTQADREAAADFSKEAARATERDPQIADCRAGKLDNTLIVQAFARCAADARIAEREACAMVAENISCGIDINLSLSMTKKEHGAYACHQIAAAIRARS